MASIPVCFLFALGTFLGHSKRPNTILYRAATGGKIVVADQIYRGRFLFASKNCENNKNPDFATLFLVLQQRKSKRKLADVNFNKR
jgi:hypothetical protein